jgi:HlyD family secretion protein
MTDERTSTPAPGAGAVPGAAGQAAAAPVAAAVAPGPKSGLSTLAAQKSDRGATVRRWVRRVIVGLLVVLGAVFVGLALRPQPLAVDVATVVRGPLEVTVDEAGRARVIDRFTVLSPVAGNLTRIGLHPSDVVTAEQAVAFILPTASPLLDDRTRLSTEERLLTARAQRESARFAITRARDSVDFATREVARRRELVASGAAPTRELELAELDERTRRGEVTSLEFALRVAEHEVRVAEASLGRLSDRTASPAALEVTSPVAGVVLRVLQESAGPVQPGTPLLEIGDPSALEIVVDVLTSDAVIIPESASVRIDRWGGEGELAAHVRLLEPSAFTRISALGVEEQRVNAIIDLDDPRERWAALGDGYRVEVHIVVWQGDDVLRIPSSAVFRREERWSTFVIEDGIAHLTEIEIGHRGRDEVEVLSGVPEGATVVVYPGERVEDGVEVVAR